MDELWLLLLFFFCPVIGPWGIIILLLLFCGDDYCDCGDGCYDYDCCW